MDSLVTQTEQNLTKFLNRYLFPGISPADLMILTENTFQIAPGKENGT